MDDEILKLVLPCAFTAATSIVANIFQYETYKSNRKQEKQIKVITSYNSFYKEIFEELNNIDVEFKKAKKSHKNKKAHYNYKDFGNFLMKIDGTDVEEVSIFNNTKKSLDKVCKLFFYNDYYPINKKIIKKIINLIFFTQSLEYNDKSTVKLTDVKKLHKLLIKVFSNL